MDGREFGGGWNWLVAALAVPAPRAVSDAAGASISGCGGAARGGSEGGPGGVLEFQIPVHAGGAGHVEGDLLARGEDEGEVVLVRGDAKGRRQYLAIEHADGDDETWLYLPALKKVRRLSSSAKKDSFVGSDLSYSDVIGYRVNQWKHTLLGSETMRGEPCYLVESRPADSTVQEQSGYSRRVSWVNRNNFVALRSDFYDTAGKLLKVSYFSDAKLVDSAKGRWQPMHISVENVVTGHRTVIEYQSFSANRNIPDDYFTTRYMERDE